MNYNKAKQIIEELCLKYNWSYGYKKGVFNILINTNLDFIFIKDVFPNAYFDGDYYINVEVD